MSTDAEQPAPVALENLFPSSDEAVLELIPEVAWATAETAAATALADGVLTVAEYEALAECASELESIGAFPGLMSYLVLKAIDEGPTVSASLKRLRRLAHDLPEDTRQDILDAARPLHIAQGARAQAFQDQWARALGVSPSDLRSAPTRPHVGAAQALFDKSQDILSTAFGALSSVRRAPGTGLIDQARAMAAAFEDHELAAVVSRYECAESDHDRPDLETAINIAAQRALSTAEKRLKSPVDLQQQRQLADRFLHTTQALIDQVRARVLAVDQRLRLQSEMFSEDLESFIEGSLDALEIDMQDLIKGRKDWTDPAIWETFKERAACAEMLMRFAPIKRRYTRLFDQWQRELDAFSTEAATIRASVLASVDRRTFEALVPTKHSAESLKCALDRVSDATLKLSLLSVLGAGAATAAGLVQAAAVVAALANPVGATIGAIVGAAALWKVGTNAQRRKDKLVKDKRAQIKAALRGLLASEGLRHDELAADVLTRFVEAAVEQYTPLIVEARLWAMKARLEADVTQRVLADTRKFLTLPAATPPTPPLPA